MVVLMLSLHLSDQTQMQIFKGHNKDQVVIQIPVIHQEVQTHGNRMTELLGIQVLTILKEIQILADPRVIDRVSNDLPVDPAVQVHEVQKNLTIVVEEDIDLPLLSTLHQVILL